MASKMNNIEESSFFPAGLLDKADYYGDSSEPHWKPEDVCVAIDTFEKNGKVILGLDVFNVKSGVQQVVGHPDFSNELKIAANHTERIRLSAQMARNAVNQFTKDANIRITVTWDE